MEVRVVPDYPRMSSKVYIMEYLGDGGREFTRADGTKYLEKHGEQAKDEDIVFCHLPIKADKLLADELARLGVKTDNDHKIAGTLEATKEHLADMRALVFKEKPNVNK